MKPLLDYVLRSRPAMAGQFAKNMFKRRNTPSGAENQVRLDGLPAKGRPDRLWVVDRILEPQTVVHFFEFTMNGKLPSGLRTALPLVTLKELMLLYKPMSAWAPAPFNKQGRPLAEMIMSRIGSFEDPIRMKLISKELMAMKSRIWEGIMPVSERRWVELGLDSPSQFHQACQFIAGVTDVFHYLNLRLVKTDLRDTYNLIWSHLDEFDKALKAVEDNSSPAPSFAALWHEYICDRYDYIAQRSHHWVIEHVERLRAPIFKQLANDVVRPPDGGYTPLELELADKLHDLAENASHADNAIFLPTDGYLGGNLPPEDDVEVDGTRIRSEPIRYSANPLARKTDHVLRMRYLTYSRIFAEIAKGITRDATIEETATDQVRKQLQTRQELRGPETRKSGPERWAAHVNGCLEDGNPVAWGYIGYRTCYSHSDDEWQQFTAKFEADIANWGSELQDTAGLRKLCKVEWRDVGEAVAASDNDSIVAAQKYDSFLLLLLSLMHGQLPETSHLLTRFPL